MKGLIMAAFVVSCALAFAQGAQAQEAPKVHSMTGCLNDRKLSTPELAIPCGRTQD
jgi:hypothetical protein